MPSIIVKNYEHLNKSLPNWDNKEGRIVKSKDHYDRLMKENNMVSYEEAQRMSSGYKSKPYVVSEQTKSLIKQAKLNTDSKGQVKLSDRTIDAMIKSGAIKKRS